MMPAALNRPEFFFYKGKMKLIENDAVYVEVWIAAEGVKG